MNSLKSRAEIEPLRAGSRRIKASRACSSCISYGTEQRGALLFDHTHIITHILVCICGSYTSLSCLCTFKCTLTYTCINKNTAVALMGPWCQTPFRGAGVWQGFSLVSSRTSGLPTVRCRLGFSHPPQPLLNPPEGETHNTHTQTCTHKQYG